VGGRSDPATLRIEPTLIEVTEPRTDPLMQEEIFGPLLPVVRVDNLEQALDLVRQGEKPLALYLFGGGSNARDRVLASTSSGSVVFNDAILQAAVPDLPFGGVGASGMGNYHGEAGFRTFSHQRSVMFRTAQPDLPVRYPPYAGKLGLMRRLLG
jgi:aldehyde dehydrogenase (NAD+)